MFAMPALTRWFVKSALVYFVGALLLGVAVAMPAIFAVPPAIVALGSVYFHFFMVGWVAQLIFGVVYWMFPRYSKEKPRGSEPLGWATYGLLNIGLVLRTFGEPLHVVQPTAGWGWVLALSAVLQWLAGVTFALNTWARIKEK
jgi:membrane protein insertase Oxa1/YidC/SpoIIIJ